MPNWRHVLGEIQKESSDINDAADDKIRKKYLMELHGHVGRNVICYYSGFLSKPSAIQGMEINDDDKNGFMLCIHGLDRSKGLDLFLHTPGGNGAATESLVDYLKQMFGNDIRAFVPQIAMSAGTIIACACKEIFMGKHSNLGPIDPQINGLPAAAVIAEIKTAYDEITKDNQRSVGLESNSVEVHTRLCAAMSLGHAGSHVYGDALYHFHIRLTWQCKERM
jgi:ClpP class serine protease